MTQAARPRLLLGAEHDCGYLPQRRARSAFLDPSFALRPALYGELLQRGFRRSGSLAYRPVCIDCQACRSVRIAVRQFRPDRSQRRCLRRNADLRLTRRGRPSPEQYALYRDYLRWRHPGGGMDPDDALAFREFLDSPWGKVGFWEWRDSDDRLLACAVVDEVPRALSAVYTFYAPAAADRGLGTYAILSQIQAAQETGRDYVYLGYWVAGSAKMDYKRRFSALEILDGQRWIPAQGVSARN